MCRRKIKNNIKTRCFFCCRKCTIYATRPTINEKYILRFTDTDRFFLANTPPKQIIKLGPGFFFDTPYYSPSPQRKIFYLFFWGGGGFHLAVVKYGKQICTKCYNASYLQAPVLLTLKGLEKEQSCMKGNFVLNLFYVQLKNITGLSSIVRITV